MADDEMFEQPVLRRWLSEPRGVLQKNLKIFLYLGAALLVIAAAIFSSGGKKNSGQQSSGNGQPQPALLDNTDNNVAAFQNQLQADQQKQAGTKSGFGHAAHAQLSTSTAYGPTGQPLACVPGLPCPQATYEQQNNGQRQLSPEQEQSQQLASKERELAFNSRFTSNLVYSQAADPPPQQQAALRAPVSGTQDGYTPQEDPNAVSSGRQKSSLIAPRAAGDQPAQPKRATEINLDSAVGQPYVIYEGTTVDTVLMNRLDGDAAGPVKVLVSNPTYSHDLQHVLIPDGTIVLGEAKKIGSAGFGQQRRLAVVFHRMIMPDGYSVDLDQFHGLDQIGEEGLKDKVNNHYLQIFGTSIALGVISGAGEITAGGGAITTSGSQAFTSGAAGGVSESATTILDQFIQIPPTITIREGHRVKVYFTQDMLLPAYANHTIAPTF
jgi:type IV secretory pathway VirB10-like protein